MNMLRSVAATAVICAPLSAVHADAVLSCIGSGVVSGGESAVSPVAQVKTAVRRRIAAPVMPKPAMSDTQVAGSGTRLKLTSVLSKPSRSKPWPVKWSGLV